MSLWVPALGALSTCFGVGLVYFGGRRALKPRRIDRTLVDHELILPAAALAEQPIHPAPLVEEDVALEVAGLPLRLHTAHLASTRPDAPVLVLLHGHSSSIREFDDLYPHLAPHFEVFSFDQPNNGASSDVPLKTVLEAYRRGHARFEGLNFLRDTIEAFVTRVVLPRAKGRPVVLAGGSLGGNLGLFVAESRPRLEWLKRVVVWSPASAWKRTWEKPIGALLVHRRARRVWRRDEFLKAVFSERITPFTPPQPSYWYWDCWGHGTGDCSGEGRGACSLCTSRPALDFPCDIYPAMGRLKVQAIERGFGKVKREFTPARAAWHWEIAAEEIDFSHWSGDAYQRIQCDVDFVAGTEDRLPPADLFNATRDLFRATVKALKSRGLTIRGRWLEQTGHSVHNERPTALTKILLGEL